MTVEDTSTDVKVKSKSNKKAPILQFTGPEGAPKIVTLMAALLTILTGTTLFWRGWHGVSINLLFGTLVFYGIMLCILGVVLILILDILDFGEPRLKKIEEVEKFFKWEVLLIFFILIFILEALSLILSQDHTQVLSSILVLTATILEYMKKKGNTTKPSKLIVIIGISFTLLEIAYLIASATPATFIENFWDASVGITVIILLLLSILDQIKFIPYQWWMVLILGFVIYGWVGTVGGTIILISFILMFKEN